MEYRLSVELEGHFDVVRHVEAMPGAVFASSSRDCTVRIWKLVDNKEWGLLNLLNPHKQLADRLGIASCHYIPAGVPNFPNSAIVTTAYDHTAVVQHPETSEIYHRLQGHSDAVVCATHTPLGDIVTGSADHSIIVWRNGAVHKRITAHSSIVWALTCLPNGYVVSGSADKSIRIWNSEYQCVKTIPTSSYIRGLSVVPEVGFLSCGSNEALQLWSYDGDLLHDLRGHKDTVYSAASLPTGELISSSEDCSVIVWVGMEASQTLATPSGVWSVAALDNGDIIAACQDKKIRVFTRDPSRYIDDAGLAAYMEDVMAAAAAAEENARPKKQMVGGREWDQVIQVELAEGEPKIPLGYNDDEEPADIAERFIIENNVPPMFLDEIIQFLTKVMGEKRFAQGNTGAAAPYIDPFRDTEVPSQFGTNLVPSSVGTQQQQQQQQQRTSRNAAPNATEAFPVVSPILVETGQATPIINKLKQLNEQLIAEQVPQALTQTELNTIEAIATKLGSAPVGSQTVRFTQDEVNALLDSIQKWPADKLFPLLDIARLAILYPDMANQTRDSLLPIVRPHLDSAAPALTQLMALRVFVNAFKWPAAHATLIALAEGVLENLAPMIASKANANIPSLAVSLLRNYATLLCDTKSDARIQILSIAYESVVLVSDVPTDFIYLGLYTIGTLLTKDAQLILVAQSMGIHDAVQLYEDSTHENIRTAAKQLSKLFKFGITQ